MHSKTCYTVLLVCSYQSNPEMRRAQKKLAAEVTLLVHGGDDYLSSRLSSVSFIFLLCNIQLRQALLQLAEQNVEFLLNICRQPE